MTSRAWLTFGAEAEPAPPQPLRAGPLRLVFDPANAFIRRIVHNEREVLRGIYAAVRDRNWGTVPPRISNLKSEIRPESFSLAFEVECQQEGILFAWHGCIRGSAEGVIRYEFDGTAHSTFLRNRIGFCVLHPIRECAGAAAHQTRTDGRVVECRFPQNIEPQIFGQAGFQDLRAVAHEVAPDLWAQVEFEGDVFEMEDQRNWTDASFKTYCTPLARRFPVEIKAGTRIQQAVTLRLLGKPAPATTPRIEPEVRTTGVITIALPDVPQRVRPRLGLGMASHGEPLSAIEIRRLRALELSHLRVDLRLADVHWPKQWERAAQAAEQLGVGLELALVLPRRAWFEPDRWAQTFAKHPATLTRVLALREGEAATSPATLPQVRELFAKIAVPVGAGSDANFCELNREQALGHLAGNAADFIFWPITPQVHALDAWSIMETLEAQPATLATARAFAASKPLVISPVTLKPRFNAVATAAAAVSDPDALPASVDPRQLGLLAAAWTLGAVAALAEAGADSVTFYETTGWRGVMEREAGSLLPDKFPSPPGAVFPVYHLFADLAGCSYFSAVKVSPPGQIAALLLVEKSGNVRLLLENLTSQRLSVRMASAADATVWTLSADNALEAMLEPENFRNRAGLLIKAREQGLTLDLPACSLQRVEFRDKPSVVG